MEAVDDTERLDGALASAGDGVEPPVASGLRILVVTRGVVPIKVGCGGAELVAYELAKELALSGNDVTVVSDVDPDFPSVPGLRFVPLGSALVDRLRRTRGGFVRWLMQHLLGNLLTARLVLRLVEEDSTYDVIHVHGNLGAALIAPRTDIPVVYTEHDATPWSCHYRRAWERAIRRAAYKRINGAAFRAADRTVTIFERLRDEIVERWDIDPAHVHAIDNGTNVDIFNPQRPGGTMVADVAGFERYCLFVGRLTPRKGPDLLLEALAEAPGVNCAFAGDGPMRPKLEQLARTLGLEDRVVFLGNIPPAQLGSVYANADFLVLPSVSEGTPLVILESMACGTPVIATRISGVPGVVRDWENGFLVKPADVGQLAMAIRFLDGDPALRERMGAAAQELVRDRYLWPRIAREYVKVYLEVIDGGTRLAAPVAAPSSRRPLAAGRT